METSDPQIDLIEQNESNEKNEKNEDEENIENVPPEVGEIVEATVEPTSPAPKRRGRPPGSKNKKTPPPLNAARRAVERELPRAPPASPVSTTPTVEDVANVMLNMLQERQATRRNAKRQLYRSFLDL